MVFFNALRLIINPENVSNSKNVLIINTEKLGDIILATDFLYSFRKANKFERYFLLIDTEAFKIAKLLGMAYEVIEFNKTKYRRNLFYRYKILTKLKSLELNTAINITPERGAINDELCIISCAKLRVGLKSKSEFIPYLYNMHYISFYSKFIDPLTENEYDVLVELLRYYKSEIECYAEIAKENPSREFEIVIAPSASVLLRNWEVSKFRSVAEELSRYYNIALIGTSKQIYILNSIGYGLEKVQIKIDLDEMKIINLIAASKLVIGLDSGISHLAIQLKKPLIAIIGGGKYGKFFPYKESFLNRFLFTQMDCFGCNWNCIYKHAYCIKNITSEKVTEVAYELLRIN